MIIDHVENFDIYLPLYRGLAKVADFLHVVEQQGFPEGEFLFDDCTLLCESSSEKKEAPIKPHKGQIVIHYVLEGTDRIGWRPLISDEQQWIDLPVDYMAIFSPQEAHGALWADTNVKKLTIKVPL